MTLKLQRWLPRCAVAMTLLLWAAAPAYANTQCTVNVANVFSGDDGYIWINYTNGGSGYLSPTDPDRQSTLAMAMTALVGSRQLIVRYAADGVNCTASGRSDLIGVYLL